MSYEKGAHFKESVATETVKKPVTYFDKTDWEVGGKNPFREAIKARVELLNSTMRLIDIP